MTDGGDTSGSDTSGSHTSGSHTSGSETVLVTGANGEIGHALIEELSRRGSTAIVAVDLQPLEPRLAALCAETHTRSILDPDLLSELTRRPFSAVYHLAALLSTSGEKNPALAHEVNVNGTERLLRMAHEIGRRERRSVRFLFPSTIAVYGLASLEAKASAGRVREDEHTQPTTIYGINKLYCERLGEYYAEHYMRLAEPPEERWVDFRGLRYPGLISAFTAPTGGTSDYAPEMIHAAAAGQPYRCFVRPDTRIPFMAMPDAIRALLELADAPAARLRRRVYNIGAFAPSAAEIGARVAAQFPASSIRYEPHEARQSIVDSWPEDVDDSAAGVDWDWAPKFGFAEAFDDYLAPNIARRYASSR